MNQPRMAARADRAVGALLGVHAGDALGATVEFSSWAAIRERYPDGLSTIVGGGPFGWKPGQATDDTDLTRAVLLAYLEPGADVVRTAADQMLVWFDGPWPGRAPGTHPKDVGGATTIGLARYRRTRDPRLAGAGIDQAGNGSLMRCIPTALAVRDPQRRMLESMEISAITHDDPRCTIACAAYNEIAAALLDGAAPDDAVDAGSAAAVSLGGADVADAIGFGHQLSPATMAATGQTWLDGEAAGYVLDSLTLAVAAVLDPRPLHDVLVDIVGIGNDTDTNTAIAGGLLGARDGSNAIPRPWRSTLQYADEFASAAERLTRAA